MFLICERTAFRQARRASFFFLKERLVKARGERLAKGGGKFLRRAFLAPIWLAADLRLYVVYFLHRLFVEAVEFHRRHRLDAKAICVDGSKNLMAL